MCFSTARLDKTMLKTMNKVGQGFACLTQKFPRHCEEKVQGGVFDSHRMKHLFQHPDLKIKLNAAERKA